MAPTPEQKVLPPLNCRDFTNRFPGDKGIKKGKCETFCLSIKVGKRIILLYFTLTIIVNDRYKFDIRFFAPFSTDR